MRQILLDTETTGFDPKTGDRIIEIGAVELVKRKLTHNNYHQYIQPERDVPQDAIDVHGITNEFLKDKPVFAQVVDDFMNFVAGAELIIHNAPFDVGFINHELSMLPDNKWGTIEAHCQITDSLKMARKATLDNVTRWMRFANVSTSTTPTGHCTAPYSTPKSWPMSIWP